jgi:hypothetical protein
VSVERLPERIARRIDASGDCWMWLGPTERGGYGMVTFKGRGAIAHRVTYELLVGPIPEGLYLDHLCRVRACVNPAHLEPVTQAENNRRAGLAKTHCINGHEYTPENTYRRPRGVRECRTCRALASQDAYRRRSAA